MKKLTTKIKMYFYPLLFYICFFTILKKEIFWKVLVTNFFGEFGDKSQLSTITLSFNHDAIMIYIGGMLV